MNCFGDGKFYGEPPLTSFYYFRGIEKVGVIDWFNSGGFKTCIVWPPGSPTQKILDKISFWEPEWRKLGYRYDIDSVGKCWGAKDRLVPKSLWVIDFDGL